MTESLQPRDQKARNDEAQQERHVQSGDRPRVRPLGRTVSLDLHQQKDYDSLQAQTMFLIHLAITCF